MILPNFKKRNLYQRIIFSMLCFILAITSFFGLGSSDTANAAISPLITSYKPQVQNVDVNASFIGLV